MRLRKLLPLLASLLAAVAGVRAQEAGASPPVTVNPGPLNPPVPLAKLAAEAMSPGAISKDLAAARSAQELGLPTVAVPLYRRVLGATDPAGGPPAVKNREELTLALAAALLDAAEAAEAQTVLATLPAPHGAAWHLRAGLAALQLHKREVAQGEWNLMKVDELATADHAWYWFLTAALYDTASPRDVTRANDFYRRAEQAATTDLARARFQIAGERVRLRMLGAPSSEVLELTRKSFDQNQGKPGSYDIAQTYAVELATLNRGAEAVEFLQRRVLLTLPAQEHGWRDEFNFLIGLIGDPSRPGAARAALNQLLETGTNAQRQRQALQLLALASTKEPSRGQFRAELGKLIDAKPAAIMESLLFYRAQLLLAEKNFPGAEDDANALLQNFPGSALRVHAFAVLTSSAWEQVRYRLAASNAKLARAELATTTDPALLETRAWLGVLEAEASFRAGDTDDFRVAADAYAAALRDRPADVPAGDLMFQRVLAEIKGGLPNAAKVLDEVEADPGFDAVNRWQAEWNLARELQTLGAEGVKQAYARVNQLLGAAPAADAAAIKPDLRARMAWLQARLSLEAGEPERTLVLADGLAKLADGLDPALRDEIVSLGALLKAQAQFALRDETHGLETLKKLRADFGKSDAAMSSYLVEADYYAAPGRDRIVDAQKLLTKLADEFSTNAYAPYALYQAALLAERLGQDDNYREANRLIVDLVNKYPTSELVFWAKLKEGDLLRRLNQFPAAQQVFEELENKFPRHKDIARAQLDLAECLNAQAADNPSYLTRAQAKFEQLLDRVDAPVDVRVEAGFNLGELLLRREGPERAVEVWWRDVVQQFLTGDRAKKEQLLDERSKGRYWMARTLERAGEVLEQQGKIEDAKRMWLLIRDTRLGYDELVRAKLARFGIPEAKP